MAEISPYQIEQEDSLSRKEMDKVDRQYNDGKGDPEHNIMGIFERRRTAAEAYLGGYYYDLWDLCDDAYNGIKEDIQVKDAEKQFRSNIRVREAYTQIESMTANLLPSLLGSDSPLNVKPFSYSEMSAQRADALRRWLHYSYLHRMNPVEVMTRWLKAGGKYGLGVFKQAWDYKKGWKTERWPVESEAGEPIGLNKIRREAIIRDEPIMVNVDTRNCMWNPDADGPSTLRWFIEHYQRTAKSIKDLGKAGVYMNTDKLQGNHQDISNQKSEERRTGVEKEMDTGEDMVDIHELWTKDWMAVIANNNVVLRYRDNPFDDRIIPYYFYRATVADGNFVGIGEIEPILDLEAGANTIRNMRLDNLFRIIHKIIFIGAGAGFKGKNLQFSPEAVYKIADVNQVKEFALSDVTRDSYLEEQVYQGNIDKTNGNFADATRGEMTAKDSSATEFAGRSNTAGLRVDIKAMFAQVELGRAYRDRWGLYQQYGNINEIIEVIGEDGQLLRVRMAELMSDHYQYSFTAGGYHGNRLVEQQQAIQALSVMGTVPGLVEEYDLREIARINARLFPMVDDPDRILRKPANMALGFMRDPIDENKRMLLGDVIEVLRGEPHGDHITVHRVLLDMPNLPAEVIPNLIQHIRGHEDFLFADQQTLGAAGGAISSLQSQLGNILPNAPTDARAAAQNIATGTGGVTSAAVPAIAPGQRA